jgi:hypothetical protein
MMVVLDVTLPCELTSIIGTGAIRYSTSREVSAA